MTSSFARFFWTSALCLGLACEMAQAAKGTSSASSLQSVTANDLIIFSLEHKDGNEVPLLSALEDVSRYFEAARVGQSLDYPPSFTFPKSFQYEMTFG